MKNLILPFCAAILIALPFSALALEDHVSITLSAENQHLAQGGSVFIDITQDIEDGWHTYYKDPGDAGLPMQISWDLPNGFSAGEIVWPPAKQMTEGDLIVNAYSGSVTMRQQIIAPKDADIGGLTLNATIELLVCHDICIPQTVNASVDLSITPSTQGVENSASHWLLAIAFAFIGGMILNLMPCVFPMLALKSLSFVEKAQKHGAMHGLAYASGVIGAFLVVASVLLLAKSAGAAVGWGFHLQEPIVVAALVWLLFAIALNLAGVIEVRLPFSLSMPKTSGFIGDAAMGALVTVVATPCTAPFMAAALGYALVQPTIVALSVFAALGAGLAAPYVAITTMPAVAKAMPKPGPWMEKFRQFLAFPMLAAAIWLAWVMARGSGADALGITLIGALVIAFAAWVKRLYPLAILALLILMLANLFHVKQVDFSKPWSAQALEAALATDKPVFVAATADWCITCKMNHAVAIDRTATKKAFETAGVIYFKADWTNTDPQITEYLQSFDRQGVPMYVVYDAPVNGARPSAYLLPQILTPDIIIDAFTEKKD